MHYVKLALFIGANRIQKARSDMKCTEIIHKYSNIHLKYEILIRQMIFETFSNEKNSFGIKFNLETH